VVDGSRTATGKPLLANDPHLEFQAPVLWYLASVEAPGLSVAGATVPGSPFHLIGHNSRIAWGTTTTHADTVDLFIEEPVGDDGYLTPEGPRKFSVREEVIRVKGAPDHVLKVRASRNGPVVSDLMGDSDEILTMRATALEPDDLTPQAVLKINRAVDWKTFQAGLRDFHAPVQNFAFADTSGAIGFMTAGRVPLRAGGDGSLPVAGHTGQGAWKAWLPFDRLPQSLNPRSGRIVNANNRVTAESYPFSISSEWPEGYRAARIGALLDGKPPLTLADMSRMQLDDLSLAALELKELVLDVEPADKLAKDALALLEAWDGRTGADRPEPLIFAAWMKELWRGVFADELGEDFKALQRLRPYVLRAALTTARHWCDDTATPAAESCEDQAAAALDRAVKTLARTHGGKIAEWKWGKEHRSLFEHAIFKHVPLLGSLAEIAVPVSGDDFTVNRAAFGSNGFDALHGAGLRAVYDLSNLDNSRFVIATGQSGNVLSRHFADQTDRWLRNEGLAVGRRPAETAVLTLEPGY
jgi:penicillin amidase